MQGQSESTPDSTADAAWSIVSGLMAGILLYGGIGYLLGMWLGHRPLFVAGGVLFGLAASLYLVNVKLRAREAVEAGPGTSAASAQQADRDN